jgi:hypothetical protein
MTGRFAGLGHAADLHHLRRERSTRWEKSAQESTSAIVARLLVPLVVGTFTHIAFQVYLERLHKGEFSGSFFDFYPHYFDGMYGFGGNFAWMGLHLWYLEALFLFSLLCLPVFLWLKNSLQRRRSCRDWATFWQSRELLICSLCRRSSKSSCWIPDELGH